MTTPPLDADLDADTIDELLAERRNERKWLRNAYLADGDPDKLTPED